MYTILTDNQVTRNRRVHYVFDPEDRLRFSAPTLKDCIEWLKENEVHRFCIDFGDYRTLMCFPTVSYRGRTDVPGWLHKLKVKDPEDGNDRMAATQPSD